MALTVAHQEMGGSPQETGEHNTFKATRKLICAWSDYAALYNELLATDGTGLVAAHADGTVRRMIW